MAKITITINGPLMDGHKVTFAAPCDCTEVDGLKVLYIEDGTRSSKLFTMKDAQGNTLTGLGNLFAKNSYVHAILDTNNNLAYLQNANTNKYIEQRFEDVGAILDDRFVVLSGSVELREGETKQVEIPFPDGFDFFNTLVLSANAYNKYLYDYDNLTVNVRGGTSQSVVFSVTGPPPVIEGGTVNIVYRILLYRYK